MSICFHEQQKIPFKPDLSEQAGQIAFFIGLVIIADVFLTIFAFGFLSRETQKKYHRLGLPSPPYARGATTLTRLLRRRPSPLALRARHRLQRLRPKSYYVNGYKSFFKRNGEDIIDAQDVFQPTINYEFNDDRVQQRFAPFSIFRHVKLHGKIRQ